MGSEIGPLALPEALSAIVSDKTSILVYNGRMWWSGLEGDLGKFSGVRESGQNIWRVCVASGSLRGNCVTQERAH